MKRRIPILALIVCFPYIAGAQAMNVNDYHADLKSDKSPSTKALMEFKELEVDLYHGLANIGVPLLDINNGNINVPIGISYHSGGVKVQEMPGWMGLNWSLFCGGEISRKVNWVADEFNNIGTQVPNTDKGYYHTRSQLQSPNWNTTAFMYNAIDLSDFKTLNHTMQSYAELVMDGEPDEFTFNFGSYSGSFYLNAEGQWKVKSKQNLHLEISDEHYFYYDAPNNRYEFFGSPENYGISSKPNNLFTKFTIITPDGFKYTFGGTADAIEFSRNLFKDPAQYIDEYNHLYNYIQAHTWKLAKIEAPTGEQVVFNYRRGKLVFKKSKVYTGGYHDDPGLNGTAKLSYPMTVINPSYLQSIETPAQRIEFKGSFATELEITNEYEPISERNPYNYSALWPDNGNEGSFIAQNHKLPHYNEQLDSIKVYNKLTEEYETGYKFFFSANSSRRRTLDSLKPISFSTVPIANPGTYSFSYSNVDLLPGYETLRKDYWGYFNGGLSEPAFQDEYYYNSLPSRVAQPPFCLYGLMNKITYPTGGTTELEYENNGYDATVKVNPSLSSPVYLEQHTPTAGSGARIKKITHKAGYNSPAVTREFFYTKNYLFGGTGSSGILGGIPDKLDVVTYNMNQSNRLFYGINGAPGCAGDFQMYNYSDNNSEWLDMVKGGFVNYSEVTEKRSGEGYIVYNYSNHDQQQYRDEIYDNFVGYNILSQSNYRLTSNDLERGNILKETYYSSALVKTREVSYEYRDLPSRKNEFIKVFSHKRIFSPKWCEGGGQIENARAWTYKIYCYQNPLKKITETKFEGSNTISQVSEFTYDDYGNKISSATKTSDGKLLTETTKYNSNPDLIATATSADAQSIRKLFTDYRIKNYPIEQLTLIGPLPSVLGGERIVKGSLFLYNFDRPLLSKVLSLELNEPFQPVTYNSSLQPTYHFNYVKISGGGGLEYDNRYKLQSTVTDYTSLPSGQSPKPSNITAVDGSSTAFTWDYLSQFKTSITRHAANSEMAYSSFEGQYEDVGVTDNNKGNWNIDKTKVVSGGFTGKKSLSLTNGDELKCANVLTNGKRFRLTLWASGAPPKIKLGSAIFPANFVTVKTSGNWTLHTIRITGTGESLSIIPDGTSPFPTIMLDEVRLYPEDATMTSYTYDSGTGNITTVTDGHDQTTFYHYDGMGRLIRVTDEKGNILKTHKYQIQGAE